jgi:hypothetical protein
MIWYQIINKQELEPGISQNKSFSTVYRVSWFFTFLHFHRKSSGCLFIFIKNYENHFPQIF